MAINKIQGNILSDNLVRGSNLAFQTDLIYLDVVNDRVGIKTNNPVEDFEIDGVLKVGNITVSNVGNINAGSVYINDLADPIQQQDGATKRYVDLQTGNIIANLGNVTFSNVTISTSLANANLVLEPTGIGLLVIDTTTGLVLPTGNTAQQPTPAVTGTIRFNTDTGRVEVYDGTTWDDVVANVTNQVLYGDNSTQIFTLDRETTAAAALVAFNGVIQLPGVAYTVTGNQITFSQPPSISDVIDIRFL